MHRVKGSGEIWQVIACSCQLQIFINRTKFESKKDLKAQENYHIHNTDYMMGINKKLFKLFDFKRSIITIFFHNANLQEEVLKLCYVAIN